MIFNGSFNIYKSSSDEARAHPSELMSLVAPPLAIMTKESVKAHEETSSPNPSQLLPKTLWKKINENYLMGGR